jgi:NADH-quinone oxidoreductase subunit F
MGSGGVIVMDEDTCMVDIARFFLEFTQEESCGKCPPCRVGTKRMLEIVERICNGEGEEGDIERLIALGETISQTSLCGLGQTAANPVLSTIRHFRHEYEAHIKDHYCEAGVCSTLFKARCSNACPASVNIPGFVSLVGEERYNEALKLHRERNPLASICARVCFHPCESKCMRSSLDGALAIRHVKRFMVEQEQEPQLPEILENAENAARKVAVVGSGPAGLSAAYFLARLGYKPVVFEAEPKAGGMLVQAIPAYRLPRPELEREIEMIEAMGARFEYGKALGRDFTLKSLKDEGYEAVFVGVGAPEGMGIGVPGEDGPGVYDGLSFLKQYNVYGTGEVGKNVAVIGGGNAAIDAARTALRLGAESVKILYRRTRAQMPAWGEEIDAADLEGIDIMTLVAPEEILRDASGKVTGVRCKEMALGDYDRSGRRRPVAGHNPDFVVEADTVIAAIGQKLDAPAVLDGTPVELNRWGYLAADPNTGQTSVDWVFTGGDAATGPSSVVEAIGAGEKAAAAMDELLTGANHAFWRRDIEPPTTFDPDADPELVDRHAVEELAVGARVTNFDEVELSWAAEVAIAEAKRCLRCDYGKYCS